jgi:serine/threonine protein kinase/WD40 repeat protein
MASRPDQCDPKRLRLSMEDRLPQAEQGELAAHLESCQACRQELEHMAAASRFWGDAHLLRGEPVPDAIPTIGLVSRAGGDHDLDDEDDDHGDSWLEFLDPPDPDQPGTLGRLGSYQVLEILGRGGMGVVLKARDPALDRTVAIKILTPALGHGATSRRRFAREARAAAAVGHEHIVAIHAVDEFRGLPYLVMQYVPGRSLQERLDASGPLEVKEILRIGTQAARALAAAHAQGVVHRDIKPANILLENCIEKVKLTDFGLARAIDDASLTQSGVIAGTPQYMAPEQAQGNAVDARADLFALGLVLYAMAAGRPPFRADSAMAVLKRVCENPHRPIRQLNPDVPDWLEALIDRLLAKNPDDRFQTATEVADLLERGLAHVQQPTTVSRPVIPVVSSAHAHPLEFDLPAAKPAPRSRRRLALAAAFALLAMAGLGASEATGITQVSEYVATILRIKTPEGTLVVKCDDPGVKVQIDDEVLIIGRAGPQEIRLKTGRHRIQAIKDGHPVRDDLVSIIRGKKEIVNVSLEPTTTTTVATETVLPMVAPASHAQQCMVCHTNNQNINVNQPLPPSHPPLESWINSVKGTRDLVARAPLPPSRARGLIWSLAFSPDGKRLAIGQQGIDNRPSVLRVWDLGQKRDVMFTTRPAGYRSVAFSLDGRIVAAGSFDGTLTQIWTEGAGPRQTELNEGSPVNAVVFLRDGNTVAAGCWDGAIRFSNVVTPVDHSPLKNPDRIYALAVSPDGSTLAVAGKKDVILIYDLATSRLKATLTGHTHAIESLDFSPDGKLLASAGGYMVKLWNSDMWGIAGEHIHHNPEILCVRFSPDGRRLAISDGEGGFPHDKTLETQIILWDVKTRAEVARLKGHTNSIYALAFSPDGKTLASGSMDQTVRLWDTAAGTLRETIVPGESGTSSGMGAGSSSEVGGGAGGARKPRFLDRNSGMYSPPSQESKKSDKGRQSDSKGLLLDQYKKTTDKLLQTEIDLIDAESRVQTGRQRKAELIKLLDKFKDKYKSPNEQPTQGSDIRP